MKNKLTILLMLFTITTMFSQKVYRCDRLQQAMSVREDGVTKFKNLGKETYVLATFTVTRDSISHEMYGKEHVYKINYMNIKGNDSVFNCTHVENHQRLIIIVDTDNSNVTMFEGDYNLMNIYNIYSSK